jgi:hypothetical protein
LKNNPFKSIIYIYLLKKDCMSQLLKDLNLVFVFGSNLKGIHGAGAALFARQWRNAKIGVGEGIMYYKDGITPSCYALPSKKTPKDFMEKNEFQSHIEKFKEFALNHPEMTFQVTKIGCNLAGFNEEDVIPMFADLPPNCLLPGVWLSKLKRLEIPRIIIAGSRDITDYPYISEKLDQITKNLAKFEVVSGVARGVDQIGEEWAKNHNIAIQPFPAEWDRYKISPDTNKGNPAGPIRNSLMAWYSTHLIAVWDGNSTGTANMIKTAQKEGLITRELLYKKQSNIPTPN